MIDYVIHLKSLYYAHADPITAEPMKAYMRHQFEFLGIKTPQQRNLLRQFIAEQGLPALEDLAPILCDLWDLPEREFQYATLGLLGRCEKELPADFIDTIETLLTTKSWWDTVDTLACGTVGTHFRRYPDVRDLTLGR